MKTIRALVKTITYDNGKEFAENARIDQALSSTGCFANPFASWRRGSNEKRIASPIHPKETIFFDCHRCGTCADRKTIE